LTQWRESGIAAAEDTSLARFRESILVSIRDAGVTGQITPKARSSRVSSGTLSRTHFEGIGTLP